MSAWIDAHRIVPSTWTLYEGNAEGLAPGGDVLLPVEAYAEARALWDARPGRLGLLLRAVDDPARVAPWLDSVSLVAVEFERFTDGRGFSIGRLLRHRYGWRGPLLATGVLIPDQAPLLARCGFDHFALPDEAQAARALALLADDPVHALLGPAAGPRMPLPGSVERERMLVSLCP